MTSSFELWQELPTGFLKKGYRAWDRFDLNAQRTIVTLAKTQKFKCAFAFCSADRALIVEHDHETDDGDRPTMNNIRGLTCQRCNWHLMIYEKNERGEYTGWDHPIIGAEEICCISLINGRRDGTILLILILGVGNLKRSKNKDMGKLETPGRFIKYLIACMKFIADKVREDPEFRHSPEFHRCMAQLKPIVDKLRPIFEASPLLACGPC